MRTSLVVGLPGRLHRFKLPEEVDRGSVSRGELSDVARLIPHHVELYHYLGKKRERVVNVPLTVSVGPYRFTVSRGVVQPWKKWKKGRPGWSLVKISSEYVDALDAVDREIEELSRKRRDLVEEAYRRGRSLNANEFTTAPEVREVNPENVNDPDLPQPSSEVQL